MGNQFWANQGSNALARANDLYDSTPKESFKAGRWVATPKGVLGSVALSDRQLTLVPFWVPEEVTFDRIGLNVTSAGVTSSTLRPAIYASGADGEPSSLELDAGSTLAADSPGFKEASIDHTLTPGKWWVGALFLASSGTVSCRAVTSNVVGVPAFSGAQSTVAGLFQSSVSQLPSTFTVNTSSGLSGIEIRLRVA